MTVEHGPTSESHRAAVFSLGTKLKSIAKTPRPSLDVITAKAIEDELITLLPLGTSTVHSLTPMPIPELPVHVGFERNGATVAMMAADGALVSALVAHQCGMKLRTHAFKPEAPKPGQFETGFLAGLATRLLPTLFGHATDVQVAKEFDADFATASAVPTACTDTQFLITIPHKPEPVTGRLRLLAPLKSDSVASPSKTTADPALHTTRVSARCQLPVQRMSLAQVAGLREGSVLTLEPGAAAVLSINGKPFATGALHEAAGHRSFRTTEHSQGNTP